MLGEKFSFHGLNLHLPSGWCDITDIEAAEAIPTLAREDGVGALQFSMLWQLSGAVSVITAADIRGIHDEFIKNKGLERLKAIDLRRAVGGVICSGDYKREDDFIRVYHHTDGTHVLISTYLYREILRNEQEVIEADHIVNSIDWPTISDNK